jgi:hypothetical protein
MRVPVALALVAVSLAIAHASLPLVADAIATDESVEIPAAVSEAASAVDETATTENAESAAQPSAETATVDTPPAGGTAEEGPETAAPEVEEPAAEAPAEAEEDAAVAPDLEEPSVAPGAPSGTDAANQSKVDELLAEVDRLGAALEEANAIIDELRGEAWDLKEKARAAEELAKSERAAAEAATNAADAQAAMTADGTKTAERDAALSARDAAVKDRDAALTERDAAIARAEAAEREAAELRTKAAALEARITELAAKREATAGVLSTWGTLRIDPSSFPELLRRGFDGATRRMGSWKIADGVASQTDGAQYFSRLTFPMLQSEKPTLYSFDVKAGAKGWVGAGLHFFAEGVRKPKGYGEGKSLLVWLTRDAKMRGDNETYVQIYRSDDDVNMERVLDAEIKEGVAAWNRIDILYEPGPEFVVIAVNGTVRAAYRTFFGIGSGVSVSLRTLGAGVSFRNFEVRR